MKKTYAVFAGLAGRTIDEFDRIEVSPNKLISDA
jgi:hypothetical protein